MKAGIDPSWLSMDNNSISIKIPKNANHIIPDDIDDYASLVRMLALPYVAIPIGTHLLLYVRYLIIWMLTCTTHTINKRYQLII